MGVSNLALNIGQAVAPQDAEVADIITFVEAKWGLNQKLYPVQRIILKAHYGIALDDNPWGLDLTQPVPLGHPQYDEIAAKRGSEKGFYKHRVKISDWKKENWRVMSEADYLRMCFAEGRCNTDTVVDGHERREMVLAVGRRSGKTQIAAIVSAYETYKLIKKGDPQKYYGLPVGEPIGMISIATDKKQAGILYNKVSGYYKQCPFFNPYTANNTMSYARFQTPKDIERYGRYADDEKANATINVAFSPCRAKGLRGPGNLVIIMDELAHFNDSGQSDAKEVYDAVTPSISAFSPKDPNDPSTPMSHIDPTIPTEEVQVEGRVLSISSPLGKTGQFHELFMIGMGGGVAGHNMFCLQAPTWEVNPTVPASEYHKHFLKDPNVFFTEYGAEFTDKTRAWIQNRNDLLACVDPDHRPTTRGYPRRTHFVGLDFALAGDGTAIAIGHVDNGQVVLDYVEEIRAGEGKYEHADRLDFDEVADWVFDLSKRFYMGAGLFDQWAGIVFEQALAKRGLNQLVSTHFTKQLNSQLFKNFKDMMWDESLKLYDWPLPKPGDGNKATHCAYIEELFSLQAEYQTKYVTVVEAPNAKGRHDDMSDAIVRMVWAASQNISKTPYLAGGKAKQQRGQNSSSPVSVRKAFLKAKRVGGSSPDRQPSRINRGRIKGRY